MSPRKAKTSDPATEVMVPLAASHIGDGSSPFVPKAPSIPNDGDFVIGSKWNQIRQTRAYEGMCWIYSPARVEFLAEASDALHSVGQLLGLPTEAVTRLEVILQRSTKRLYFRPAGEKADDYFDVTQTSNDYFSVNIRSLLQPPGLEIKTGHQSRFRVSLEVDSPVGPALVVDLKKVEEHRRTARRKATQAAKAAKAKGEGTLATASTKKASPAPAKAKKAESKVTPEASVEASATEAAKPEASQQPAAQPKASQPLAGQPKATQQPASEPKAGKQETSADATLEPKGE